MEQVSSGKSGMEPGSGQGNMEPGSGSRSGMEPGRGQSNMESGSGSRSGMEPGRGQGNMESGSRCRIGFDAGKGFIYHWCGKFVAPGPEWVHLTRHLTDYEFILVTEGILHIADDKRRYDVSPREYLLMTPTLWQHGLEPSICSFYWMHLGYDGEANDHAQDNIPKGCYGLNRQDLLPAADRLIILMEQLQDSDRRYHDACLNNCLCNAVMSELFLQLETAEKGSHRLNKEQLYEDICNYVSWHIGDALQVNQISDYFGYNEKYLTTFFKEHSGMSIKQYILLAKMDRAGRMLIETDTGVAAVAAGLGFTDVHNFSNAFKKVKGLSPLAYRDSYNKRNVFRV